ncbi:uncharacterized protein Dwil_GK26910 [Drosophila willistoni]|uniref:uncharacterized protein LOC26528912 n=1 Tax=Drosophila willistoni TaxID=7260 RepID=UPI000732A67C|nr:uncharacterized protein LOC26528912 [Drosophila willistoni]KRF97953.1 uncharacterized protein Dwil_GK26910 [Drosophila willistoni]
MSYLAFILFIINWKYINSALLFTTNSEYGIFMAISVPLILPHRNVFLSYNYEFNYYQPEHVYKYPPILMGDYEDSYLTYPTSGRESSHPNQSKKLKKKTTTTTTTKEPTREKRSLSLMTRSVFYIMIKDKLDRSGYPAEACLLRMICETNASTLGEVNGFLGNLVHIIFTPSTSKDEHLSQDYYQAEWMGHHGQDCSSYKEQCRENVLDLISKPIEELLTNVVRKKRK